MPRPDDIPPGVPQDSRASEPRAEEARGSAEVGSDKAQGNPPGTAGRVSASGRERREFVSLLTSRVRDVFLRKPFFVDGGTDLVSLCRELSRLRLSEALVRDGDRIGIFTTTDLRDALTRETPPDRLAVREVAVFDPWSVSLDDELYDALILMLRHRIHRLLVRDGDGGEAGIVGVLGQLDLMAFVANHSHLIALEAAQATSPGELKSAARQIDSLVAVLHADGVRVEVIAALVGELNRQIFRRLWDMLAPEALRANSCLLVMGSEGRGEQIIKTDQDNALLIADGFACEDLPEITERFTAALIDFGYPPCPGGIMLSRPLWCQPLSTFKETLRRWIHGGGPEGPDKDGPMNLAIFLDAAPVAGDAGLLKAARAHVDFLMMNDAGYFARFAEAVQRFGEGGSWWSRLPGLTGRAAAEIDLKKLGIFPLVHGVRALALEHRIAPLGTADRLKALVATGHMDDGFARDLTDALRFLMGLKLAANLRQMQEGRPPGNAIRLGDLGPLDRQALKEALAIVRGFKQWLARHYRFDAL
ncbi:putative nucleotidyltransferase substrate binding domain-containing protein [Xanthobacter autotrophicus DSM 431]|uniref:putative nucleotidyltransferase substrate binding domain-containing protein n=1 Tax=Xanthobacter nonsaccharivorans TaxID=3119912 RepID=UPI003727353F